MRIGEFEVQVVSGGRFRLDGGSMFGIVPKALWERLRSADEHNRIALDTNCVLVRTPDATLLIDTGNGAKIGEKDREIFAIHAGDCIEANLTAAGVTPAEITHVILTHLHLDHAGGGARLQDDELVPAFPNARYFVQRGEFDAAAANRSHMKTTYRDENFLPLRAAGVLELLDGDAEIVPGVRVAVTGGHTPHHQAVLIQSCGQTAFYAGDICPTTSHLRAPYNMAYDLDPLTSMRVKGEYLARAAAENWLWLFDHDPETPTVRITESKGVYSAVPVE